VAGSLKSSWPTDPAPTDRADDPGIEPTLGGSIRNRQYRRTRGGSRTLDSAAGALRFRSLQKLVALVVLAIAVGACSDDTRGADESLATQLTTDERSWCSFADSSEQSAVRFDLIFQAGLALDLPMDALNSQAATLSDQYLAEGSTADEATRRVSEQLLDNETFAAACKQAYADEVGG